MDEKAVIPDDSQAPATDTLNEIEPTIEEAIVRRHLVDVLAKPNQRFVDSIIIHRSKQQSIEATHMEIMDRHTGFVHHHGVKIEATKRLPKSQGGGWPVEASDSVWINDDGNDAIGMLRDFLSVVKGELPEEQGSYLIVPLKGDSVDQATIRRLIDAASTSGKSQALVQAVEAVSGDPEAFEQIAELASAHPDASKVAAAALNLARYTNALDELARLLQTNAKESEFQALLTKNAWIFGSEYSELLARRVWVRDQQKDFMLRRAADDYLEIIEIKTPLSASDKLFIWDKDHDCFYPRQELTKVVAQVMLYLEGVDADRLRILAMDNERVNKIVARIIIGRDHDPAQVEALRRFNSHQGRIEVLTFDQLIRIGRRVVEHVHQVVQPIESEPSAVIGQPPGSTGSAI